MEATSSWRRPYVHRRHLILQEFVSNSSPPGRFRWVGFLPQRRSFPRSPTLRVSTLALEELMENPPQALASSPKDSLPKIDKSGRFCSPRAARELALLITYAACLEGSDPVRLFEKRMNARREPGYEFDKTLLTKYNHMSFGGPPVTVETVEEADELMRNEDKESAIEAEVLSAPPKLVYSKLILRFTRKLLVAIVERWNSHVLVIDKVAPSNWKNEPAGRILEFCILHLAMSEITVLGTRRQIVINEAVDIAKRFCDGAAPRIINGCLRTFVTDLEENGTAQGLEGKQILFH
ncbi:N utilization substance protein like [Actinidia chinensis var. chinensis]|uniref:N utilization substance protein like n=1 Tax=Actinidia chinensis var. chinensis TaxID=1590841 RepID=A0A2R6PFW4_ACTCC|nr:N utilization substance protein like [Actinidia chinensis var. chinensis]